MSFTLHGIAVSSGIAIGYAHLISHTSLDVAHYVLPKAFLNEEIARFDAALAATRKEFAGMRSNRPTYAAAEFDAFLELHQMILDDPLLSAAPREMIASEQCNAEWAIKVQTETLVAQFDAVRGCLLARAPDRCEAGGGTAAQAIARATRAPAPFRAPRCRDDTGGT